MDKQAIIALLELEPHPEGGFYRETWRQRTTDGSRGSGTAIYFLLGPEYTSWHRVDAAEIWHFYGGDAVELQLADSGAEVETLKLGSILEHDQRPQRTVCAHRWQRARSAGQWSLVGCTVSPAFEFSGYEEIADPQLAAADEIAQLVDEQNREIGRAPRQVVRRDNLLHRGTAILCQNSAKELYVHRRTETKDVFAGLYDLFAGGLVQEGESYLDNARRELEEELGISGVELEHLFDHRVEHPLNRSWVGVFRAIWDGPIRHQPSEVAWGGFLPLTTVIERLEQWTFVPDGLEIFQRLLDEQRIQC